MQSEASRPRTASWQSVTVLCMGVLLLPACGGPAFQAGALAGAEASDSPADPSATTRQSLPPDSSAPTGDSSDSGLSGVSSDSATKSTADGAAPADASATPLDAPPPDGETCTP